MSKKIDETLKKLAASMQSGKTSALDKPEAETSARNNDLPGDPNCPHCGGLGYLRLDLPPGHPQFGRLQVCSCRHGQVSQQVRQRLFALSNLDELSHLNFENFQPRGRVGLWPQEADSLERAYNQARQFAQSLNGWVVFQGGYGCGKTHLAAAIANFAVDMGVPTLFITVPDLLDSLRYTYDNPEATFEERFEEIRRAPLLVLDDFGTQNATAWSQEKLFQIFNYRYINRLPLVVTTNTPLEDIEGRIRSRLEDPDLVTKVHILAPDYRRPAGDTGQDKVTSLDVLYKCTFANFDLREGEGLRPTDLKSLKDAFRVARHFAEHPKGWLVFSGPNGCGKTHLAAAIGQYRRDQGGRVVFTVVPDLLDHLRATFNPQSTVRLDRRFEEVRTAPLLILDDLGTQAATPWVREKLYQLFNYRYNAELPTVITTADYVNDVDPRLLSRMEDRRLCEICLIEAPSYRGSTQKPPRRTARRR